MASTGFKSRPSLNPDEKSGSKGFLNRPSSTPASSDNARSSQPLDDNLRAMEDDFYNRPSKSDSNTPEPKNEPSSPKQGSKTTQQPSGKPDSPSVKRGGFGLRNTPSADTPKSDVKRGGFGQSGKAQKDPNSPRSLAGQSEDSLQEKYVDAHKRKGDKKFASKSFSFIGKHRKTIAGGGGIAGLIVLVLMAFFSLLPLKLEAIMKNIMSHQAGRMEDYVERRVQIVILQALFQKITGTYGSNEFYIGSSIYATIIGNMQINKFEQELLRNKGIRMEKTGPNSIRFTTVNGDVFDADSEARLIQYLNTDLKGKEAKKAIKAFVNDRYKPWRFLKRRHMRKFMMNAFNIRTWGIRRENDQRDPANPNAPSSTEAAIQSSTVDPASEATISSVDCVLANNCEDPNERRNPDGTSRVRPPIPDPERSGDAANSRNAAATEVRRGIRDAYGSLKTATTDAINKSLEAIFGRVITKAVFKAVPVVGWLALAADIDKFFWDGNLKFIGIALRSSQYAGTAATWGSLADQFKAGELTGSQINIIMRQLNGVEKSNGVQMALGNDADSGVKLPDDKRVGSDSLGALPNNSTLVCDADYFFKHGLDPPPSSDIGSADFWTWTYRQAFSIPPQFVHTTLCIIRVPLNAISDGIGWLIGDLINEVIQLQIRALNALVSKVVGHDVDVMAAAQSAITWVANLIWTPVVHGRETGIELGNAISAGWDVVSNQMCRDTLGCKNIPYELAYQQQLAIAESHRAELRQLNPIAALINTDYPESFGSQMLVLAPSTPGEAMGRLGSTGLAMISEPFRFFGNTISAILFPPARAGEAAPTREPFGVQQTGLTEAELDDPNLHLATKDIAGPPGEDGELTDPDGRVDQYDCPVERDANKAVPCLIDTAAAQVICAAMSSSDDGGLGGNGDPGPCGDINAVSSTPTPDPGGGGGGSTVACQPGENEIDCASRLAAAILANGKVQYAYPAATKGDLQAAVNKQTINNSDTCGKAVRLDPALLYALQQSATAGGFTVKLTNIITGHGCDQFSHPKGKSFDVDNLIDSQGRSSDAGHNDRPGAHNPAVDRAFSEYIAGQLPQGGGVAQAGKCFPATIPAGIRHNYDVCSHIHVTTAAP